VTQLEPTQKPTSAPNARAARPKASRPEAVQLLRAAHRVFIIYSSSDLQKARDLRRRIVRLRKHRPADSVFLAAESLPPGTDVSPEAVSAVLAAADLVVIACGVHTPQSPFVIVEIRQAMAQRRGEVTKILPVILKTGVRLPDGIDFDIQAIDRTVLFPAIRWIPIAAMIAILALAVVAVWLQIGRMEDDIRAELRLDDLISHSPLDLTRVRHLETMRQSAAAIGFRDGRRRLEEKLRSAGTESMRHVRLPPDADRMAIVTDPAAALVWIGYRSRIDVVDPDSFHVVRSFDLGGLKVDPFVRAPIGANEPAHGDSDAQALNPAHLLALQRDPRVTGVLAEVSYDDRILGMGPEGSGTVARLLHLDHRLPRPESVGMTKQLEERTLRGHADESPSLPFAVAVDHREEVFDTLSQLAEADASAVRVAERQVPSDMLLLLAIDPRQPAALIEARTSTSDRHRDDDWADKESMRDYAVGVLAPAVAFRQVVPTTRYYARKRDLSTDDNLQWGFSDVVPDYTPAALHFQAGEAWIHDDLVPVVKAVEDSVTSDPDAPRKPLRSSLSRTGALGEFGWLADGSALRMVFADKSVGRCGIDGRSDFHRFLFPPGAHAIDLDPRGTQVLVLYANGQLDAWDLQPFGYDGLAGSSTDPDATPPPARIGEPSKAPE